MFVAPVLWLVVTLFVSEGSVRPIGHVRIEGASRLAGELDALYGALGMDDLYDRAAAERSLLHVDSFDGIELDRTGPSGVVLLASPTDAVRPVLRVPFAVTHSGVFTCDEDELGPMAPAGPVVKDYANRFSLGEPGVAEHVVSIRLEPSHLSDRFDGELMHRVAQIRGAAGVAALLTGEQPAWVAAADALESFEGSLRDLEEFSARITVGKEGIEANGVLVPRAGSAVAAWIESVAEDHDAFGPLPEVLPEDACIRLIFDAPMDLPFGSFDRVAMVACKDRGGSGVIGLGRTSAPVASEQAEMASHRWLGTDLLSTRRGAFVVFATGEDRGRRVAEAIERLPAGGEVSNVGEDMPGAAPIRMCVSLPGTVALLCAVLGIQVPDASSEDALSAEARVENGQLLMRVRVPAEHLRHCVPRWELPR